MRKFIIKSTFYFFMFMLIILPVILYFNKNIVGMEVDLAMKIASRKYDFKIRKIRIGDSVGKNLFGASVDFKNNEINICSNRAISILGQFLLIKKLGEKNDLSNTFIEGYFLPESLLNNLNEKPSRNYFLKKFYNHDWFLSNKIIKRSLRDSIDNKYLNQYHERNLYELFYTDEKCLLSFPSLFNNFSCANEKITKNDFLISYFSNYFKNRVKFYSNPIALSRYSQEINISNLLKKSYGIDFSNPVVINDSFFMNDLKHLKTQYRLNSSFRLKCINY